MGEYVLTEEQDVLRKSIRELAEGVIAPRAEDIDEKAEFPRDIWENLARYGWLGLAIPEEFGGMAASLLTTCVVAEEVARVCASSALILVDHFLSSAPLAIAGSTEQKSRYLARMAIGEHLAAFALMEPDGGSDYAAMGTSAVLDGDRYRINGTKCFVNNGGMAETYTVFAASGSDQGPKRVSAFIVEKSLPGLNVASLPYKMGMRGIPTADITLKDCTVPLESILGQEGDGLRIATQSMERGRVQIGSLAVGIAQAALESAASYAKERVQFRQTLASFPAIQFKLAEMAMRSEAARQLVYGAAAALDMDAKDSTKRSAMAKCFASDTAVWVTTEAMQILGAYGYMREYRVERLVRDAKVTQMCGGTNELQHTLISQGVLAST